ncbi:MAG: NAD(P)-dependent oxidoreductase, partial [Actinomycetota bacterium]
RIIDPRSLGLMKRGSYLVNTARGALVNEPDLVQALRDGRLGGAALDVYDVEPPSPDNPLFALDNVIFSTHIAGTSDDSFKRMSLASANNILAILRGEPLDPGSLVNQEIFG